MKTIPIKIGNVFVGGDAPITIQTMTNTDTENISATIEQIQQVTLAGCDIIRVSCPTKESTSALKKIIENITIPIVADIHFNYKRAIEAIQNGAHCVRFNPGNLNCDAIKEIVKAAKDFDVSLRIGINSGSLEQEILKKYHEPCVDALVENAMLNINKLYDLDFHQFKISIKSSDVQTCIESNMRLSELTEQPLHIGVTEAGPKFAGTIKSAICIGALLSKSVGSTIRVSLSASPLEEIKVAKQILKSLGLLKNGINIISCPTCARTLIDVINISNIIDDKYQHITKPINISILGCVVNGIGEAQKNDIGVFGFQKGIAKIYRTGKEYKICKESEILSIIEELVDEF